MNWATLTAFAQALPALLKLLQTVADYAIAQEAKGVGRAEAVTEALTIATAQLEEANKARQEAEVEHKQHPDDDDGFDKDFQRP
jgi:hypothetical protein